MNTKLKKLIVTLTLTIVSVSLSACASASHSGKPHRWSFRSKEVLPSVVQ